MTLHVFDDIASLSAAAAKWITDCIQHKLKTTDRFTWLLSGGNTPKQLYHLLATEEYRNKIDWTRMHVFFGDERAVPFEDERNNGRMSTDSLLAHVNIPAKQVHYIDTSKTPAEAARRYDNVLHEYFTESGPGFDLSLLGMGDDAHTLSLFPGSPIVRNATGWVDTFYLSEQAMDRITLLPALVNRSGTIIFLVAGKSKAPALKHVLAAGYEPGMYPAQLIRPATGDIHWFVDKEAASLL